MRLANTKRIVAFVLAFVFCVGSFAFYIEQNPDAVTTVDAYNEPMVLIGMYANAPCLDSRCFSSHLTSDTSGFDIGFTSGESFAKLFTLSMRDITVIPQTNADFSGGDCVPGEGSVGAYSALVGVFTSYSEAKAAADREDGFVAVTSSGFEARYCSASSADEVRELGGDKVCTPVSGALTVLDANSGKIIFTYEDVARPFALRAIDGGTVVVPVRHYTGTTTNCSYPGFFEYSVNEGLLRMINYLGLEDYTKCVMANEIGFIYSVETRKAFSVLARTVPLQEKHYSEGYDVCGNPACCQVYFGTYRMGEDNNQIVDSTRGMVATYEGKPIISLYHKSNGGTSCSGLAAWGSQDIPYLAPVTQVEFEDGERWQEEFTKSEFYAYLKKRGRFAPLADENISMKIVETDPLGSSYITVLSVSDSSGNSVSVKNSETIRNVCGFTSANFTLDYSTEAKVITADGSIETKSVSGVMTADGYKPFEGFDESYTATNGATITPQKVTVNGSGTGHGVGFSVTGSEQLAKDGYSYEYILGVFFNGVKVTPY